MHRILFPLSCITILFFAAYPALNAQSRPEAGQPFTIRYVPPADSPLASADELMVAYVYDLWNVRYGTRLALWENVLRPDTTRVHYLPLTRGKSAWSATIEVPVTAALLSYIITDGRTIDGNNEKTYTSYVYNANGKPVQNARFFNVQFLRLAQAELGALVQEAEREILDYPENFQAYHQYFKLLLEQGKGGARVQQRIATRLDQLEQRFGADPQFLNMAAETWYYVLQDQERGLEYRSNIPPAEQWPQVFRMYSRDTKEEELRQRQLQAEQHRNKLLNAGLPAFNLLGGEGEKVSFPETDGKAHVIVFWASTSLNSGQMLGTIREVAASFPADAVEVAAVSVDTDIEKAAEFFRREKYRFTLLFNQGSTLQLLGVDSIPICFVVDGQGIVRSILVGNVPSHAATLRAALGEILE